MYYTRQQMKEVVAGRGVQPSMVVSFDVVRFVSTRPTLS